MELIATIPYTQVNFFFITSHWDSHLEGICIYKDEVCEFKASTYWYDEEPVCYIYNLDFAEKVEWFIRRKIFEWFVGHHWTYKDGKKMEEKFRRPKLLRSILHMLYYQSRFDTAWFVGIAPNKLTPL